MADEIANATTTMKATTPPKINPEKPPKLAPPAVSPTTTRVAIPAKFSASFWGGALI
ncbi:MAG: hypothetical protein ACREBO_10510 [Novosphingobium sp.]